MFFLLFAIGERQGLAVLLLPILVLGTIFILSCWRSHWASPLGRKGPFNRRAAAILGSWLLCWLTCLALIAVPDTLPHRIHLPDIAYYLALGIGALLIVALPVLLLLTGGGLYLKGFVAVTAAELTEWGFLIWAEMTSKFNPAAAEYHTAQGFATLLAVYPSAIALALVGVAFVLAGGFNTLLGRTGDAP